MHSYSNAYSNRAGLACLVGRKVYTSTGGLRACITCAVFKRCCVVSLQAVTMVTCDLQTAHKLVSIGFGSAALAYSLEREYMLTAGGAMKIMSRDILSEKKYLRGGASELQGDWQHDGCSSTLNVGRGHVHANTQPQ